MSARAIGVLLLLAAAAPARAFTVDTGFSDPCHERITREGFLLSRTQLPSIDEGSIPRRGWEPLLEWLAPDVDALSRAERFSLLSLLVGARAPDSEGYSLTNVTVLRAVHSDPDGQAVHCLRAAHHDHGEGDGQAIDACREAIREELREALAPIGVDAKELLVVPFTLDNHGTFDVSVDPVWYHLGRALHALEDSFSHTLRTPDLRAVVHVMNYEEAVAGHLEEDRDGMAHSAEADRCELPAGADGEAGTRQRVSAAIEAVAELIAAFGRAVERRRLGGRSDDALAEVEPVLSRWLGLASPAELGPYEACTRANDYCDSPWLATARIGAAQPIVGCSALPGSSSPSVALLAFGSLLAHRRWSRR